MTKQTRRGFLKLAAVGGAGLAAPGRLGAELPWRAWMEAVEPAKRAMNILILGGTGFTGPHQVRYAVARGHSVTVFNRGRSQADLPEGVERLVGDRNTGDLSALEGRTWDVVIDNPTTLPFWARDAASLLHEATEHYTFISTISAYRDLGQPGIDVDYPLAEYTGDDPYAETLETMRESQGQLYGPLKAVSEREIQTWFPDRSAIVRPGLIVGPRDPTDRFTYWPVRVARGGEVLAPGDPEVPVQIIDGRDLAEWVVRLAEERTSGVFNGTGPAAPLPIEQMLHGVRAGITGNNRVSFTWVDQDFLAEHEVQAWGQIPVWIPVGNPQMGAWGQVNVERSIEAGLTYRPLAETVMDTLAWFREQPEERQASLRAGLPPERERELLEAWKAR